MYSYHQLPMRKINPASPLPYYAQLIELLRERVNGKTWLPGHQLPGEEELCRLYAVSRTVVRQALRELELEGLVTRRKGKGTFVAEPKISEGLVQKLTGFYADMVERGYKPVTRVLHQQVVPAGEDVSRYLQIKPGTQVVDIRRLRFINDEPIQVVTTYIPYALCPALADVDLSHRSLYEFLQAECHIELARGHRYIEAVVAGETEARLLGIPSGAALLLLDSVSTMADGTPVEYYHALHRGDRSRFEVDLIRY